MATMCEARPCHGIHAEDINTDPTTLPRIHPVPLGQDKGHITYYLV